MDRFEKFICRIDAKLRLRVLDAAEKILRGDFEGLDIQRMRGNERLYRCRIGDVRILFAQGSTDEFFLVDADFRGRIYKQ